MSSMRRVVIDTNCLLAILPSHSLYHNLSEKTSSFFADAIIKTILNRKNVIRVSPTWRFKLITQDPDDNKFVDCAIAGQAEFSYKNLLSNYNMGKN